MNRTKFARALGVILIASCDNAGQESILDITSTGTVVGGVFFDVDGSGSRDSSDLNLPGIRVGLVFARGNQEFAASAVTRGDGTFQVNDVPVGSYTFVVDSSTLGDTAQVARIDTSAVDVLPNDTVAVQVIVSFPTFGGTNISQLPTGTRVFIQGVALNQVQAFGDTTLHVADTSGAIRVADVRGDPVATGDSVRVSGTVATRGTEFLLRNGRVTRLGIGNLPAADSISTSVAALADSSRFNSALVRIAGATVTDTATVDGNFVVGIDDGTGRLTMILDEAISFNRINFRPPAELNVSGLLVQSNDGSRQLKPRSVSDVDLRVPFVTVDGVRAGTPGDTVLVIGVTANDPTIFGDSTLHLSDATRAIRVTDVSGPAIVTGDSLLIRGVVAARAGQPVLRAVAVTNLASVGFRDPVDASSSQGASAGNGAIDAVLVLVENAVVQDTATSGGDFVVTVDDGSGDLKVRLDADVGLSNSDFVPGAQFDLTGLLVPTGSNNEWELKPRSAADVSLGVAFVTIAQARLRPPGDSISMAGIALNDRATFGDNTIHVADSSGTIITTVSSGPTVFVGDSVRVRGIVNRVNGQPVIANGSVEVIGNSSVGPAVLQPTALARTADGGRLDGALVRVDSAAISARTQSGPDVLLTVSDGSGTLTIRLDVSANIDVTEFVAGAVVDVVGLLVATNSGTWELKPRATSDLTVRIPVVTITEAKDSVTSLVGTTVTIVGTVASEWATFGDSTIHIVSGTSAIRAVMTPQVFVLVRDSVRATGVVGLLNGQRVLQSPAIFIAGTSNFLVPAAVSTASVASGFGGRRDAQLVSIAGAVVSATSATAEGLELTVSDGSGDLVILVDTDTGIDTTGLVVAADLDVVGVLVPVGGNVWRLQPRSDSDIVIN